MEVFFVSRGMNEKVEKWKKYIETWMHPYPYIDKEGNKKSMNIQGWLDPIQLWGYAFPYEQRDKVLSALQFGVGHDKLGNYSKFLYPLRKILKCEPIPKDIPKIKPTYIGLENMQLLPIGMRQDIKDAKFPDGTIREQI